MQYDPKLKAAMEQIKTIMKNNDIGGVVILHRPGFVEFLNKINPAYSCAKWELGTDGHEVVGARFLAKKSMYPGGAEERERVVANTANLLENMVDIMGKLWLEWDEINKMFVKAVGPFEHTHGNMSTHIEQNN